VAPGQPSSLIFLLSRVTTTDSILEVIELSKEYGLYQSTPVTLVVLFFWAPRFPGDRVLASPARWQRLPPPAARDALLAGQIDAAFLVEASVGELLRDPAIRVTDYPAADAQVDVSPVLRRTAARPAELPR
jgi:hypothetical protein